MWSRRSDWYWQDRQLQRMSVVTVCDVWKCLDLQRKKCHSIREPITEQLAEPNGLNVFFVVDKHINYLVYSTYRSPGLLSWQWLHCPCRLYGVRLSHNVVALYANKSTGCSDCHQTRRWWHLISEHHHHHHRVTGRCASNWLLLQLCAVRLRDDCPLCNQRCAQLVGGRRCLRGLSCHSHSPPLCPID